MIKHKCSSIVNGEAFKIQRGCKQYHKSIINT